MSNNDVYKTFREDFPSRHFIRFGENRHLSLFIGRDDDARYSFDFRGKYKPVRISSSDVIAVEQYQDGDSMTLRFSLENSELLEYFCTFCQDLLDSVRVTNDDETAYQMLEDAICKMMRVDEDSDPVENWKKHCEELSVRSKKLNDFKRICQPCNFLSS